MLKKLEILLFYILYTTSIFTNPVVENVIKTKISTENGNIELPELPEKTSDKELAAGWKLQKNYTALLESKLNVFVPLEILSDVDIKAIIIDNEELNIPFEIELNKEPEKKDYYRLKFSETEIDVDNDGRIDTYIYSPKYINRKIIKDNYVNIKGSNISKDGEYYKKIYITIEIDG